VLATEPKQNGGRRVVFLSGDDAKANSEIANLIEHLGFAAITSASWRKVGHLSSSGDRWLPST
jgi:predicted dinucleotide-binding enzyme